MNCGSFSIIDGDRRERTRDDVTGFLSEKASRSASVNEFKLTCQSITGKENELGPKLGQEKENTASFSTSFGSTKLTKERAINILVFINLGSISVLSRKGTCF